MDLTLEQLEKILPGNPKVNDWFDALSKHLPAYEINTQQRIAAFLAQCVHESGGFKAVKENLNYKAEGLNKVFHKYFPTVESAEEYAHNPEKIANKIYADRMGNGDEASGDGFRYCGRGLIQLTGKENYTHFADSIGMSHDDISAYMETTEGCVHSACWFWGKNHLNELADAEDLVHMTKKINGGTLGLDDRTAHYHEIMSILG
jgi:putative chitinase